MRGDRDDPDPEVVQGVTDKFLAVAAVGGTLAVFAALRSLGEP